MTGEKERQAVGCVEIQGTVYVGSVSAHDELICEDLDVADMCVGLSSVMSSRPSWKKGACFETHRYRKGGHG